MGFRSYDVREFAISFQVRINVTDDDSKGQQRRRIAEILEDLVSVGKYIILVRHVIFQSNVDAENFKIWYSLCQKN